MRREGTKSKRLIYQLENQRGDTVDNYGSTVEFGYFEVIWIIKEL